jgi:DNA invertase Pin-like site-specific DNA recombinase
VKALRARWIRERQREGVALAKKVGVYKGRKPPLTAGQGKEKRWRVDDGKRNVSRSRPNQLK